MQQLIVLSLAVSAENWFELLGRKVPRHLSKYRHGLVMLEKFTTKHCRNAEVKKELLLTLACIGVVDTDMSMYRVYVPKNPFLGPL